MTQASAYEQFLDYSNRADPYPLFPELRGTPVARQPDGSYVVSTYQEIVALLHDPRVSSDLRNLPEIADIELAPDDAAPQLPPEFIRRDPPDHDRLRSLAMKHFGPPCAPGRVHGMTPRMVEIITDLIDGFAGKNRIDIVDDFAYPLPVTVICELLGVPREDEPRFHKWSQIAVETNDPTTGSLVERNRRRFQTMAQLGRYLNELVDEHRRQPGDDLLSALVTDGEMAPADLLSTAGLLLIAGHETTVNLIANGMLTLLRHPDVLERLRREPGLIVGVVEELLRYEPPIQMPGPRRSALADIDIAGTTIPKGSVIILVLAAGSRDPARFTDPDRFDPERKDNQHLGFGGGIHYCFGAPLARLETRLALSELTRRLVNPRLVTDPPLYRRPPNLRGPRHLLVDIDGVSRRDSHHEAR
ncbi:cytochrome P450 [Streptosporangium sp. 'caverna']|uniref:cytochrome P450 n=1 Tax=Streptosporangium sp. 'caverna' TaxID=2202249 RepID=UPI000D7D7767|nr:cytochrome P450 [Streptosporangium sp. 'caverna']AWS43388.1 cytochrome P450 [Streptosporangium sp. 'caverna']